VRRDILFNVALPYATYLLLCWRGVATVPALAAGSIFPIGAILVGLARERRIPALGVIVLIATAASIIAALALTSPYLALAKGSLITGAIGIAFGLSLLARRPLIFYLALTDRDAAARARAEILWRDEPRYRRVMRQMTIAWTAALLAEATLRLILVPLLPIAIFLPMSEAMWMCAFAAMMTWSWRFGRRKLGGLVSSANPGNTAN
jgi:hypothetical protein